MFIQKSSETPNGYTLKGDTKNVESLNIPGIGAIYFIYQFDKEYSSATYRTGTHKVLDPYTLE